MPSRATAALDAARGLYRRLPSGPRRTAGRVVRGVLEPALAARLPRARPGLRTPADAATLVGPLALPGSFGTVGRLLALELRAAGVRVSLRDVSAALGEAVEVGDVPPEAGPGDGAAVLVMNPGTAVQALSRGHRDLVRDRRVVGYWVYELERPPRSWRVGRGLVHEVWTSSQFSAQAARAAFDVPVVVVPHPCALQPPDRPTPELRRAGRALLAAGPEGFIAFQSFALGSSLERKNPFAAIRAFTDAFAGAPGARLVLRVAGGDRWPAELVRLRTALTPQVVLLHRPRGLAELTQLYAACDVYVSLHRSEGFGLNLAEASLSDRAVLATGWSGNLDFMTAGSAALVPHRLVPVADPQGVYDGHGARWAEPDHDAAVEQLRRLRADPDERAALAARGAAHVRQTLSGGMAARVLRDPL